MKQVRMNRQGFLLGAIAAVVSVLAILIVAGLVFAHGGKMHASSFTPLRALQKGTELFDQLVGSDKLAESWETDLTKVEISNRHEDDRKEYVVSFQRSVGDPSTVYIFFTAEGKYSGSNFTGE